MRVSDDTRFPHPVLSQDSNDFASGEFDVHFQATEIPAAGRLQLEHEATLTEPGLFQLVMAGTAGLGCIVRCEDTYYTELRRLSWPKGSTDFPPGALLNRVTLRPVVWLEERLDAWDPGTIHKEFAPPVTLSRADVVAVGPEYVLSVGQAKFQPIESIFELKRVADMSEGRLRVDPEGDRIAILVAPGMYEAIGLLRGQARGQAVVLNAVYMPAAMEVLDYLRTGLNQFEGYRWFRPFAARCDANGLDIGAGFSPLEAAQTLLENPARALVPLAAESDA